MPRATLTNPLSNLGLEKPQTSLVQLDPLFITATFDPSPNIHRISHPANADALMFRKLAVCSLVEYDNCA